MVHNANQRILYLQQQLTEARDRITEYESKPAVTAHHPTGNPGDDPDQPFELTGQKAEVRNTISAFALTYSPWPNMTALQFPHPPRNLDPLDPLQRYSSADDNTPRAASIAVQIWDFLPLKYLPYLSMQWFQKQASECNPIKRTSSDRDPGSGSTLLTLSDAML